MLKLAYKFVRFKILTTCYLIVILGSLSSGSISFKTFFAIFVLVAWYIHAASSNDYADRKIDEINLTGAKNRPLVEKAISHRKLWIIHSVSGVLAILLSAFYGVPATLLTLAVLSLDYMYSFKPFRITDRGALAQLMLPIAYVIYPFSLGYWSVQGETYPWLLVAGLYCGFIARLFLKDFRDVEGDKKFGKLTFLIRHGRAKTCLASELFGLASLILLSLAVDFSAGVLVVIICGHLGATYILRKLAAETEVKVQLKLVAILAKIANTSVLAILIYYACLAYSDSNSLLIFLPLAVGTLLLSSILIGNKNDLKTKLS